MALEKTTLTLVWATKKLKHYMLTYTVHVVAPMDPIRYLLQQLVMSGKVARWIVTLLEFDLHFMLQKSIKRRAVSNVLADLWTKDQWEEHLDLLDEEIRQVEEDLWTMYFDGASDKKGFGLASSWYHLKEHMSLFQLN